MVTDILRILGQFSLSLFLHKTIYCAYTLEAPFERLEIVETSLSVSILFQTVLFLTCLDIIV